MRACLADAVDRSHLSDPLTRCHRGKVRDGHRPVYIAMGVDVEGRKNVLGLWLRKGDEGAKFLLRCAQ
jgi:hypothetical protein